MLVFGVHQNEPPDKLAAFRQQTGVSFPFVADANRTLEAFVFPQGVGYPYPRDIVVDKHLVVRSIRNSFSVDETVALVQQLMKEP